MLVRYLTIRLPMLLITTGTRRIYWPKSEATRYQRNGSKRRTACSGEGGIRVPEVVETDRLRLPSFGTVDAEGPHV
jgi:hypothetical protein